MLKKSFLGGGGSFFASLMLLLQDNGNIDNFFILANIQLFKSMSI